MATRKKSMVGMIRWEITYAGSFMGNIDAKTRGAALGIAKRRWGGNKNLYGARQTVTHRNPSKRSTVKRVGKALKKYVKRVLAKNPRRKYQVHVPATRNDRGYEIKVSAPTAASARSAARKYCAKRAGVPVSKFHLPKGTKVKVI